MRAVVFHGPHKVAVEDRPLPTIQDPLDIIVKVKYAALCGRQGYQIIGLLRLRKLLTRDVQPSELHVFRGHQPCETGFIMGHEFTGTVVEAGNSVKTVKMGDSIVSPFTISW